MTDDVPFKLIKVNGTVSPDGDVNRRIADRLGFSNEIGMVVTPRMFLKDVDPAAKDTFAEAAGKLAARFHVDLETLAQQHFGDKVMTEVQVWEKFDTVLSNLKEKLAESKAQLEEAIAAQKRRQQASDICGND